METLTLGGGCFWCLEAVFQRVKGVQAVRSGYAGGHTANPSYESVCHGDTGHAEVVEIQFDRGQTDLDSLLDLFFAAHDPTTLNRQGNDVGPQYRSIILYRTPDQKAAAERAMARAKGHYPGPIVTELLPFKDFTEAENHHQDYYNRNQQQPYCQLIIRPKLEKLLHSDTAAS
ncbi:peptide-methionine (S)-S-oxide reductase MsrA [Gallaecimonas sp. GXIMD4217]|uniref:peptide-methionine (S)-S-oxide reductase MsrA n=1 Tax=Gallaecimonas sp. GXIMD4217 TaxID=3131927 RepID=UPI00311B1FA0